MASKETREPSGLDILADRLAIVLNTIPRPINADEIDLRMVAELAWCFDLKISLGIIRKPDASTLGEQSE